MKFCHQYEARDCWPLLEYIRVEVNNVLQGCSQTHVKCNDNDNDFISNIHTYLQIMYLQVSYLQYHCCVILGDQYSINAVFLLTPDNIITKHMIKT